jgi:hypothetical protein
LAESAPEHNFLKEPAAAVKPLLGRAARVDVGRLADMHLLRILRSNPYKIVSFSALECRATLRPPFRHGTAMHFSHTFSHCTIDFCSAAIYVDAV